MTRTIRKDRIEGTLTFGEISPSPKPTLLWPEPASLFPQTPGPYRPRSADEAGLRKVAIGLYILQYQRASVELFLLCLPRKADRRVINPKGCRDNAPLRLRT